MTNKIGKALVVGAGISGIRTALDLAETGYRVTLIDRAPHLGGILSQLDYQFPSNHCGMCKMLPLVDRDASSQYCLRKGLFHDNIDIQLSTELVSVEGDPGNYQVRLRQKPNWVNPDLCVGCGKCGDVCPVDVADEFNSGLATRKAIYLPVPHAIPNPYIIDFSSCTRCGECQKICPTGAIKLAEQERERFHILVVDDELIVRDSLKEWLEEEGFTVDVAASGPEALEKLNEKPYQLMLTDIKMPGMDGVELLNKAKQDFPELTVVMMTAYATVETAVEAMKTGALDYLVKPFDPDQLISMTLNIYEDIEMTQGKQMETGAVILCGGTDYYDPCQGKNIYGYKKYPNVITSIEFERIFSGSGPSHGDLVRPFDGKPIRKVGWIQCVGSRDLQTDADFCSNICCMFAMKEAMVAIEKSNQKMETTIFYMDMRTFGKSFQRYHDQAKEMGVSFQRGRVHSVDQDGKTGELQIRYMDNSGTIQEANMDMVVLSVGQRPSTGTAQLAEKTGLSLNPWGFMETEPFSLNRTTREGIVIGGAYAGLKDISESVTQSSSAALTASRVIHASGGGIAPAPESTVTNSQLMLEAPDILVVLCTCNDEFSQAMDQNKIATSLKMDPLITQVSFMGNVCTREGWEDLLTLIEKAQPNRVLLGACLPYVYRRRAGELNQAAGIPASLVEVVDIRSFAFSCNSEQLEGLNGKIIGNILTGAAKLKRVDPAPAPTVQIFQNALVVGGGISGMTAALGIADHGFQVDLVEKSAYLGGNLRWLKRTLEGHDITALYKEMAQKVEKHPLINLHLNSQVLSSYGDVGNFFTTIETEDNPLILEHGITIVCTGGNEHQTSSYQHGSHDAIVTQKEFETKLKEEKIKPDEIKSVVMIQCVDSREEPRNYCSRICCATALKNALFLKKQNPEINVYVLYRDMMSYGFSETYYTEARREGVIFIQYDLENRPEVAVQDKIVQVTVLDPILGSKIAVDADQVILATGVSPSLPLVQAEHLGISLDRDGFFQEAESKWRPIDSIKEGIFGCGLAHSPRNITEAIATAEAAAQRSLRIIFRKSLPSGKVVAKIHHAICSLCGKCIDACPFGARVLDDDQEEVRINPVMCQGCGSCATVCPNGAAFLDGFPKQQMFEMIDVAVGS